MKISEIQSGKYTGKEVEVRGWIYRTRSSGKIVFVILRDSSGIIQIPVGKNDVGEPQFKGAKKALVESSVIARGVVREDSRAPGGFEITANYFEVVHFAEKFPITKDQSDEFLLDNRHLWLRSRELNSTFKIRSTVFKGFHDFFSERGFYEIQSPSFVTGACEGGSTLFEVKYTDEKTVYLTQSWQLYAEAMMFSLEKIYTIAPSFRAEKSRTRRHVTEFWHAEVEAAWFHNEDMMKLVEELIVYLCELILEKHLPELEVLNRDPEKLKVVTTPFERVKYRKVLDILRDKGIELEWGDDFGYVEEKALTLERDQPFFITHFPLSKGFYHRPDPEEPDSLLCHDLLAPEGYGEIVGGGERIWEPEVLMKRFEEENLDAENYSWYLDLRKYGSVPHSGFGLGLERALSWFIGSDHIKNVIPFPRTMRRTSP
ncbi:MAG: asparagine--tRNA ligase [Thermoplasmata archaeon]|nr:MAG: asparagine--tRNA ligase [Thermoplasmata archaeon]